MLKYGSHATNGTAGGRMVSAWAMVNKPMDKNANGRRFLYRAIIFYRNYSIEQLVLVRHTFGTAP
jgi:hypothetical protein